jgi:hypothetical protein
MQSASELSSSGFSSTRQPHSVARRRNPALAFSVIRIAGSAMALCRRRPISASPSSEGSSGR